MVDLVMSVKVSRPWIGLADLEINDHLAYYVAPGSFGGSVTWQRQQVTSPYVEGAITVNRTRNMVEEPLTIEVRGDTQAEVAQNIKTLVQAFTQTSFTIGVYLGGTLTYQWACEAADYSMSWDPSRLIGLAAQVKLNVPRQPRVDVGGI